MNMENNNRSNGFLKFLFGMFFGVLAGYIVGILTADRTGSQLRRDIEMGSSDFFMNMRDRLEDLKDQASV
jgi:gas vesicle protein